MSGRRWRDEVLAPTVFAAVVAVFSVAGPAGCGSTGGGGAGGGPGAGGGGGTPGAGGGGASGSGVDAGGGGGVAGAAATGAGGGRGGAAGMGAGGGGRGGAAGMGAGGRAGAAGTGAGGVAGAGGGGGGAYRIAVGGQRACAVSAAGVVYCWGTNTNLLGLEILDNYSLDSAAPVDMTPFLGKHAVNSAVTDFDLCVLKDEGSVFCAGADGSELVSGIGGPAVQICAGPIGYGFGFGCAVRSDGHVFCWDDNGSSVDVLNGGGPWQAVQATGVENAVAVACDAGTACAVQSDGTVLCWGGGWGTPDPSSQSGAELPRLVTGFGTDAVALAGGEGGICAFSSTGAATCIGSVFGVTRSTPSPAPIAVPALNGVRTLAIGDRHVCAVGTDGQPRCWGANDFGQLADGTFVAHATPALAPSLASDRSAIVQLAAGEGVTCASLADGSVRCVGSNDRGALGDGSALSVGAVPVSLAAGAHVAAYQAALDTTGFAVQSDGSVVAWGGLPSVLAPPGGPPLQSAAPAPVSAPPAAPAAKLAWVTDASACVLTTGGAVSCLGTSAPASFSVVSGLASGVLDLNGTCVLPAGGGVRCGVGSTTSYSPTGSGSTGAVAALASGYAGNCLLHPDGTVACWQSNNPNYTALAPVQDLGGPAIAIAVGDEDCAVRDDGAVFCWGAGEANGEFVQLPDAAVGVTAASGVVCRRFINGNGFGCFVDSFHGHACAWTAAGDLYCWGDNTFGQLGDGTTTLRTGVVQATATGGPVLSASAGNRQTCAVRAADGRLVCWGWNGAGELGTGTGGPRATAAIVALP